ncbi:MAG: hypothetical protein KDD39_16470, partial [Bdellovibrionales bacterium]|nr:hypothetical protein [Bdellovibrionales bacterium]
MPTSLFLISLRIVLILLVSLMTPPLNGEAPANRATPKPELSLPGACFQSSVRAGESKICCKKAQRLFQEYPSCCTALTGKQAPESECLESLESVCCEKDGVTYRDHRQICAMRGGQQVAEAKCESDEAFTCCSKSGKQWKEVSKYCRMMSGTEVFAPKCWFFSEKRVCC